MTGRRGGGECSFIAGLLQKTKKCKSAVKYSRKNKNMTNDKETINKHGVAKGWETGGKQAGIK